MGIKMKKSTIVITLVGPYPPPYGGISIHIQRLKAFLDNQGYDCIVYGVNKLKERINGVVFQNVVKRALNIIFLKQRILHWHYLTRKILLVSWFLELIGRKIVISIHNSRLDNTMKEMGLIGRKLTPIVLKNASFIIADNSDIKDFLLSLGVTDSKLDVVSAFIPPIVEKEDYKKIPQYVWDFMESHDPVISAGASRISFYKGIDLYGLDMMVGLLNSLIQKYSNIGIIFCLPDIWDEDYFKKINQEIMDKGLANNILFITEPLLEVYPIWIESDIFVRPTSTDGDPLSIREALSLKTPVVTSDACPRPDGVVLFKNRDLDDFVNAVQRVLENYDTYKKQLDSNIVESGAGKIINIYKHLYG